MKRFYLQHCQTLEFVTYTAADGQELPRSFSTEQAAWNFRLDNGYTGYKVVGENV